MAFHVVGAGLAGLAAATALASAPGRRDIVLHEAAPRAGGRCRSWPDPSLGVEIDNGTHALLGANDAALRYVAMVGAQERIAWLDAGVEFIDLRDDAQWRIASPLDLLRLWRRGGAPAVREAALLLRLLLPRRGATVPADLAGMEGLARLAWEPLLRAIMNAGPGVAAAMPFARAMRRVLRRGRAGMRVGIARRSLADSLVDPALDLLARAGAGIRLGERLRATEISDGRLRLLRFDGGDVALGDGDQAILALPPWELARCAPGLAPDCAPSPIVNLHAVIDGRGTATDDIEFRGLVGGTAEWVLRRGKVASATTSAASGLAALPQDEVFALLWPEVARGLRLPPDARARSWRVVVERRATPLQDPGFEARRPGMATGAANLLLAGDWVQPGLPCTIEAAIASGAAAAGEALARASKTRE